MRIKTIAIIISFIILFIISKGQTQMRQGIGLNIFYGTQVSSNQIWHYTNKYSWNYISVGPTYNWKWGKKEIYLEGSASIYDFGNGETSTSLGLCLMGKYNIVEINRYSFFGELGGGMGWWSYNPSHDLVNGYWPARMQYGFGIRFPLFNKMCTLGYRFHHISFLGDDCGLNSEGILFGVEF